MSGVRLIALQERLRQPQAAVRLDKHIFRIVMPNCRFILPDKP
jgi:hypothetical protein